MFQLKNNTLFFYILIIVNLLNINISFSKDTISLKHKIYNLDNDCIKDTLFIKISSNFFLLDKIHWGKKDSTLCGNLSDTLSKVTIFQYYNNVLKGNFNIFDYDLDSLDDININLVLQDTVISNGDTLLNLSQKNIFILNFNNIRDYNYFKLDTLNDTTSSFIIDIQKHNNFFEQISDTNNFFNIKRINKNLTSTIFNQTNIKDFLPSNENIIIFPNPTTNIVYLKSNNFNELMDVNIFNINGILLAKHTIFFSSEEVNMLNFQDFSSGFYIINLKGKNFEYNYKINLTK